MGYFFIYKKFPACQALDIFQLSAPAPTVQLPAGPTVNILGGLFPSLSNNSIT